MLFLLLKLAQFGKRELERRESRVSVEHSHLYRDWLRAMHRLPTPHGLFSQTSSTQEASETGNKQDQSSDVTRPGGTQELQWHESYSEKLKV